MRTIVSCLFSLFALCLLAREPTLTIHIPMRDGTELPTDLYLPDEQQTNLPCVLIRCPSGKNAETAIKYTYLADQGFALAIQDTRSSIDPEGKTIPYLNDGWHETQDGYDTVQWLANSIYTNGKVGTLGASALGMTQLMMAPSAPPALKCQYIQIAAPSLYHYAIFPGGQFLAHQVQGWLRMYARHPSVLDVIAKEPHYGDFWEQFNILPHSHRVNAPAVHEGGWYDIFVQGTIDSFQAWQKEGGEGAKNQQKLIIGPWSHFWPRQQTLGDFPVPAAAKTLPIPFSVDSWLNYHLKGEGTLDQLPPILYYVMGPFDGTASGGNIWRSAQEWPIPATETPLYLNRNRTLTFKDSDTKNYSLCYLHNPKNPVPTLGGRNLFLESGPKDQHTIEERDDVIVFTSEPLQEEIEVTGRIFAHVFFSSNRSNSDVVVRLCDVYPDGKSLLIADGLTHIHPPQALTEPQEVEIDLWSTSIVFAKGHRIRISISNSNSPRFATDPSGKIAKNFLHFGPSYPSRITLPIVKR